MGVCKPIDVPEIGGAIGTVVRRTGRRYPIDGVCDEIAGVELPVETTVELLVGACAGIHSVGIKEIRNAVKSSADSRGGVADEGRIGCAKWGRKR